jgi:hypothetical protein
VTILFTDVEGSTRRWENIELAKRLVGTADAIANPWARSYALLMYGMACCDADPLSAGEALRMGLVIAHESGNRSNESHIANVLGRLEARYGDPLAALEYLTLAIRNYHDSGSFAVMRVPLASLAVLLHQLGHHEPSATIAGYALSPITKGWVPEFGIAIANLCDVLGDQRYTSLVRQGSAMAVSMVAAYAYDQIDQAPSRTERRLEIGTDYLILVVAAGECVLEVPHLRGDGEQVPLAGHALELTSAALLELQSRSDHQIAQRAGHEHVVRAC